MREEGEWEREITGREESVYRESDRREEKPGKDPPVGGGQRNRRQLGGEPDHWARWFEEMSPRCWRRNRK